MDIIVVSLFGIVIATLMVVAAYRRIATHKELILSLRRCVECFEGLAHRLEATKELLERVELEVRSTMEGKGSRDSGSDSVKSDFVTKVRSATDEKAREPWIVKRAVDAADEWVKTAPAREIVPYFSVWTRFPVIDAVFLVQAVRNLSLEVQMIPGIQDIEESWYFVCSAEPEHSKHSFVFSDAYFDRKECLFKVYAEDAQPNLYAIRAAIRGIVQWKHGETPTIRHDLPYDWALIASSSARFVKTLKPREEWQYRIRPTADPSIFSTFAAVDVAWGCALDQRSKKFVQDFELGKIGRGLTSEAVRFEDETHFAFKRGLEPGCLSTSEYAFRICHLFHDLGVEHKELETYLKEHSRGMLNFIRECWDTDSGGFKWTLERESITNLGHTRSGLRLLRTLLARGDIERCDVSWLDLSRVLAFVDSCWTHYGFANIPKGQPNLSSLRNALNVQKLILLFKQGGVGNPGTNYAEISSSVQQHLNLAVSLLESYYVDRTNQVAYMCPIPVIQAWKPDFEAFHRTAGSLKGILDVDAVLTGIYQNR